MGNYFGISTDKNNASVNVNNNNIMEAKVERLNTFKTVVPKLSRFINIVTTEVSVVNLYNSYKESNFSLKTTTWSKPTSSNKSDYRYFLDCHTAKFTSSEKDDLDKDFLAIPSSTRKLRARFKPAVSDRVVNGINTFLTRYKQIEPPNLVFTTVISMVDLCQPSNIAQELKKKSTDSDFLGNSDCCMDKVKRGVSFFVDLNEPYHQCPLEKKHRFSLFNDCWSDSDGDSLCSFDCHGDEMCEDFIVFDDDFGDNNCCELRISVNCQNNSLHKLNSKTATLSKTINDSVLVSKIQPVGMCEEICETQDRNFCQESKNGCKTSKKVRFETDENLTVVYHMKHWDFAYREARKGPWELAAVDRSRFCRRIQELDSIITPCLQNKLQAIEKCKVKNNCM